MMQKVVRRKKHNVNGLILWIWCLCFASHLLGLSWSESTDNPTIPRCPHHWHYAAHPDRCLRVDKSPTRVHPSFQTAARHCTLNAPTGLTAHVAILDQNTTDALAMIIKQKVDHVFDKNAYYKILGINNVKFDIDFRYVRYGCMSVENGIIAVETPMGNTIKCFEFTSQFFSCQFMINPCDHNNNTCRSPSKKCEFVSIGIYKCVCMAGYHNSQDLKSGDVTSCHDIDECAAPENKNGGCDQKCVNKQGGFECVCDWTGFIQGPQPINRTCECDVGYLITNEGQFCVAPNVSSASAYFKVESGSNSTNLVAYALGSLVLGAFVYFLVVAWNRKRRLAQATLDKESGYIKDVDSSDDSVVDSQGDVEIGDFIQKLNKDRSDSSVVTIIGGKEKKDKKGKEGKKSGDEKETEGEGVGGLDKEEKQSIKLESKKEDENGKEMVENNTNVVDDEEEEQDEYDDDDSEEEEEEGEEEEEEEEEDEEHLKGNTDTLGTGGTTDGTTDGLGTSTYDDREDDYDDEEEDDDNEEGSGETDNWEPSELKEESNKEENKTKDENEKKERS